MKHYIFETESVFKDLFLLYEDNILVNARLVWKTDSVAFLNHLERNGYIYQKPISRSLDEDDLNRIVPKDILDILNDKTYDELMYVLSTGKLKKYNADCIADYTAYIICTTTDLNLLDSYKYLHMLSSDYDKAIRIIKTHSS